MKLSIVLIFVSLFFISCSKGPQDDTASAAAPSNPTTTVVVPESDLQEVIDLENQYRVSVGQAPLTQGLVCNLYAVPTTTTQIVGAAALVNVASFTYMGVFNQPNVSTSAGLNILPTALQVYYTQWYIVKCTGQIAIVTSNYYEFELNSDDGSNLYLDGALVLNNDGLHGAQTKTSIPKILKRGVHTFELDFLQANGNEALILTSGGVLVDSSLFYH